MKKDKIFLIALSWIFCGIAGLISLGAGIYMAINNKDGWGWFLVLGLLFIGGLGFSSKEEESEEEEVYKI